MGVSQSILKSSIRVTESLDSGVDFTSTSPGEKEIIHYLNLDATDTPGGANPVTKVIAKEVALSAGAVTLDFTAITGTNGRTQDMSGLKLQHLIIKNKTGNAAMTFEIGASNGYTGLGSAFSITLAAEQYFQFYGKEVAADVAAGDKTLDVTGTGTQAFQLIAVFG